MKRKLLTQMRTEGRGNIWMILEFLLMAVVFWYSSACLISVYNRYHPSEAFDFSDVYVGHVNFISSDSPDFTIYGNTSEEWSKRIREDLTLLVKTLENDPNVEIVGLGKNAIPFEHNFNGSDIVRVNEAGDTLRYAANIRVYDINALKALRVTGTKGESAEELGKYLDDWQIIISDYDKYTDLMEGTVPVTEFREKDADLYGIKFKIAPVGVDFLRRDDYEPNNWSGIALVPPRLFNGLEEIIIRIKHGHDLQFREALANMNLLQGNLFITDIQPVAAKREAVQKPIEISILKQIAAISFVLILIFLGLLGTFWFRTQERTSEIAIRKVAGATRGDILRHMFGEGFILMGIAVTIAMGLSYIVTYRNLLPDITGNGLPEKSCYYAMVLTVVVMALMVLAGIYFPARRAMKINPAIALKDQ